MTDLTDFMTEDREQWVNANSTGAQEGQAVLKEEQRGKDDKIKANGRVAYDATDLGEVGPPEGQYDYNADYAEGNTFKADEEGGIELSNKKFKPGASSVAGIDVASGKKYSDEWDDANGNIAEGQRMLSEGKFNTKTGATYDQTDGLFKVAQGMVEGGGTFDNFIDQSKGPWSMDQLGMAWHAAKTASETMSDIDNQGRKYYDQMVENYDQFAGIVHSIPAGGYTEESLSLDKSWIDGSRKMGEFLFGEGSSADKSDAEVAESMKFFISQTRNNLDVTMMWANRIISEGNPELARNWLALDAQYDAMDTTMESVGRFGAAQMNITNLLTFGGGVLISTLGKFATGEGIKSSIKAVAYGTAYDAALSGAAGAGENVLRQKIEITAGERGEVDPVEASFAGIINATAGAVIGGGINVATNKTVRDYATGKAGEAIKFMNQNAQDIGLGPMPGSPKAQRGSVGIPDDLQKVADEYPDVPEEYVDEFYRSTPEDEMSPDLFRDYLDAFDEGEFVPDGPPVVKGDDQVHASFKLQELLQGVKDGAKITTVQQQIKAAMNKGLITPQEVKWSGVEDYLDMVDVNEIKLSRGEMLGVIENKTPHPQLVPAKDTQYDSYSLLAAEDAPWGYWDESSYIVSEPKVVRAMVKSFDEAGTTFEHITPTGEKIDVSGEQAFKMMDFEYGPNVDEAGRFIVKDREGNVVHDFQHIDGMHDYMWEKFEEVGKARGGKSGYSERMLVLPGGDPQGQYSPQHFAEAAYQLSHEDAMIGHSRVENAAMPDLGDGKMVLEIQSDFHKKGQQGGYIDNDTGEWVGTQEIQKVGTPVPGGHPLQGQGEHLTYDADLYRLLLDQAYKHNIDPRAKNAMSLLWPYLDAKTKGFMATGRPPTAPYGKDWDAMGMRLEIMDSINKGDNFIAYPASGDQIAVIEQWGSAYEGKNIAKRATVDRNKAMKKMGLEVEQVDMPQYGDKGETNISGMDSVDIDRTLDPILRERRQKIWSVVMDDGSYEHVLMAYPNSSDWKYADEMTFEYGTEIPESVFKTLNGDVMSRGPDFNAIANEVAESLKPMSTIFNVIRLTDEVKARFRKEGMNMYGIGGLGTGAAIKAAKPEPTKPERERDENGRFKAKTSGIVKDLKDAWKVRQGERRVEQMLKDHQKYQNDRRQGERRT